MAKESLSVTGRAGPHQVAFALQLVLYRLCETAHAVRVLFPSRQHYQEEWMGLAGACIPSQTDKKEKAAAGDRRSCTGNSARKNTLGSFGNPISRCWSCQPLRRTCQALNSEIQRPGKTRAKILGES